jgi:integrase/recombinase XerD
MLEFWYKDKRTLVDFRRGLLGPHFDGFAAYLQARGYTLHVGRTALGKCCQFNGFLLDQRVSSLEKLSGTTVDAFLARYFEHAQPATVGYSARREARRALKHLFDYLIQIKVLAPPSPKRIVKPYSWLLDDYLRHLRVECQFSEKTVKKCGEQISQLLESLGPINQKSRFKSLKAEAIEKHVKELLQNSTDPSNLVGAFRRFLRHCASQGYLRTDFSGLVPPIRRYRHSTLPKGISDSSLEQVLAAIPKDTAEGTRDYALMILLMAYGVRGVSAAQLLLDDLDWQQSRIRIRAQKGGKEVMLPLMQAVGEALIQYLQHRPGQSPHRNVFLTVKAPYRPLDSCAISQIVRRNLTKAGIKVAGKGTRSFRHSWAIRALAYDSPIKAISDVLGHRYIDTTFIYAKADLKSLRQVALPWPTKD